MMPWKVPTYQLEAHLAFVSYFKNELMANADLFCFWCKANDPKCLFMALLINDESSICRHHIRSIFFKQPPKSRSVSSLYVHTFCRIVTKLKLMTKSPFMIQRHSRGLLEVWTTIWSLLVLLQANVFFKKKTI